MENLKIKVNTPEESKGAQELFFELGFGWRGINHRNSVFTPSKLKQYFIVSYGKTNDMQISGVFDDSDTLSNHKEITLPELRDMVAQKREQPDAASPNEIAKKEYLLPTDQWYELCLCEEGMTIHASWIEVPEGAEVAVLFEPAMVSNRSGELFFWKDNGDTHYVYSERSAVLRPTGWYSCKDNQLTTLDEFLRSWKGDCRVVWRREQSAASPNDIAKTAEVHREHNLSNELNDLCAEFGCPPGVGRMAWLREKLKGNTVKLTIPEFGRICAKQNVSSKFIGLRSAIEAKQVAKQIYPISQNVTVYHYSASINTARGTVAYDGVITLPGRITGIEDYQKARAEIAKDGNVAPDQVNVLSLSIIN